MLYNSRPVRPATPCHYGGGSIFKGFTRLDLHCALGRRHTKIEGCWPRRVSLSWYLVPYFLNFVSCGDVMVTFWEDDHYCSRYIFSPMVVEYLSRVLDIMSLIGPWRYSFLVLWIDGKAPAHHNARRHMDFDIRAVRKSHSIGTLARDTCTWYIIYTSHLFFNASNRFVRLMKSSSGGGLWDAGGVLPWLGSLGFFKADLSGWVAGLYAGGWTSAGGRSGSFDTVVFSSGDKVGAFVLVPDVPASGGDCSTGFGIFSC